MHVSLFTIMMFTILMLTFFVKRTSPVPRSGMVSPTSSLMSVDLPAPLAPTTATRLMRDNCTQHTERGGESGSEEKGGGEGREGGDVPAESRCAAGA